MVYSSSREALILTLGIEKEAQILQASFWGSVTPRMAFSSGHHADVPIVWLATPAMSLHQKQRVLADGLLHCLWSLALLWAL